MIARPLHPFLPHGTPQEGRAPLHSASVPLSFPCAASLPVCRRAWTHECDTGSMRVRACAATSTAMPLCSVAAPAHVVCMRPCAHMHTCVHTNTCACVCMRACMCTRARRSELGSTPTAPDMCMWHGCGVACYCCTCGMCILHCALCCVFGAYQVAVTYRRCIAVVCCNCMSHAALTALPG